MGKGVYDTNSPHFKGTFLTIYAVNQKYPTGGVDGDWCLINGWAHYWDADRGTWCVNSQRDTYWDELFSGVKFNTENIMKKYEYLLFDLSKKANTSDVQASLDELKKEIGDRTVIEGNVTNLPDEEDITSGKNESGTDVLSLKDRAYNPLSFSGKGYKILRKNIKPVSLAVTKIIVGSIPTVDGAVVFTINGVEASVDMVTTTMTTTDLVAQKIAEKLTESMTEYEVSKDASTITLTRKFGGEVSTPSSFSAVNTGASCSITDSTKKELRNIITPIMMNQPNTIYEIRYDFDLDGETIEVPEGCTLKFDSGSINNGKLLGIFTIKNSTGGFIGYFEFNEAVTCSDVEPEWFYNTLYGDSYAIQKAIILAANSYKKVILSNRTYKLNNAIYCYGKTYLLGNNTKFELLPNYTIDNDRIITNCKTIECSQNDEGCVNYENKFYKWFYTTNDTVVIDNIEIIGKSTHYRYFGEQLSVPRGILSFVDLDFLSINRLKRDMAEDWENQPIWTFNVNNIEIKNCTILKNLPDKYTENFGAWLYGNKELNSVKIENCYFYGLKTDESIAITNKKGNVKNIIILNNTFISEDSEHLDGMAISVYSSFGVLDISNNILIGRCVFPYNGKILKFTNNHIASDFIDADSVNSNLIQISGTDEDRIVTFSNNKVKTNGVLFWSYSDLYNVNISNNVLSCTFLVNKTSMELHDIVIKNNIMECAGVIKSTSAKILKGIYISNNILEINGQDLVNFNVTKVEDVFILNNKIKFNNEKYHIAYTNLSFSGITFYDNIIDNDYYYDNSNDYYSRYNGEGKNVFNGISVRNYTPETVSTSSKLYDLNSKNGIMSFSNDKNRLIVKIGNVVKKISTTDNLPAAGGTSERPTNPTVGYQFYDYTQKKTIIWNGKVWIDGIGNPTDAKKKGATSDRPTDVQIGYIYKDTSLGKLILWDGTAWVNMDGTELETSTSNEQGVENPS